MKGLKKLVLASAIIAASSSAFAMQAMDDDSMSATTGQDGLTITLDTNLSNLNVAWIDRDGITTSAYNKAGGITISPLSITATGQVITIDAGGNAGDTTGQGQLRVNLSTTGATTIGLSGTEIKVGDAYSTTTGTIAHDSTVGNAVTVVKFATGAQLQIAAGMDTTILLGNLSATEHFIHATASLPSISLSGITIHDAGANGGGDIGVGTILVNNLVSTSNIDVVAGGLKIDTTGTQVDGIGLSNVQLGTVDFSTRATSIGDVYITGAGGGAIALNNTITVTGH